MTHKEEALEVYVEEIDACEVSVNRSEMYITK